MKNKLALVAGVVLVIAFLPMVPAEAGGSPHMMFLEKVLVGGGDPLTEYEIVATCVETNGGEINEDGNFVSAADSSGIGLGNEAQTCTLSETDPGGATPSFACTDAEGDAVCVSGNVVQFTGDGVPEGNGSVTITITNTFGVVTSTTTTTTAAPTTTATAAAAAAEATAADPSFTG